MAFQDNSFQNNAFQLGEAVLTMLVDFITFARRKLRR